MQSKAFTLAEVLITVTIIGIVASITIPSLINNSNDAQYTVSLKKIYSELIQATAKIQMPGSEATIPDTVDAAGVRNAYRTVFGYVKEDTAVNIFGDVDSVSTYRNYKGTAPAYMHINNSDPAAIMANGMFIGFYSGYRVHATFPTRQHHEIYIDTNGSKGPNMYGFDLHKFYIQYQNGYYRVAVAGGPGEYYSSGTCVAGSTTWSTSWACTAVRLTNPAALP